VFLEDTSGSTDVDQEPESLKDGVENANTESSVANTDASDAVGKTTDA